MTLEVQRTSNYNSRIQKSEDSIKHLLVCCCLLVERQRVGARGGGEPTEENRFPFVFASLNEQFYVTIEVLLTIITKKNSTFTASAES